MLYGADSMLSFDGQWFQGAMQIVEKLASFPKVRHNPLTADMQPTTNGVLCFVCGDLYIDDSPNPIKFSQVFHIIANQAGGYYCKSLECD